MIDSELWSLRSCPSRNPQLQYLPNLYNDLLKVFRFQEEKKVSQLVNSKEQPIRSGEQEKTSDLADASESDSDGDSQSDKGDCFLFLNLEIYL